MADQSSAFHPPAEELGLHQRGGERGDLTKASGSLFDQPGTDGIAEHMAQDREEMAVLLNGKAFEPSLPHVPMTAVMPMVAADMTGHPPLHEGAQRSPCGRLHDEMKMIGHEAEAKEFDRVFGFRRGEQVEEGRVVPLFVKHRRAAIAPI